MKTKLLSRVVVLGGLSVGLLEPSLAQACGGLFCSSPNLPVNQAAERIVFSQNPDGTVTAVIQIAYQGPAQKFSWLLPISSVPTPDQIGLGSNVAFQRLQSATNPSYSLQTRIEGTCKPVSFPATSAGSGGASSASGGSNGAPSGGGVSVEASGTVGAFDWTVISVDSSTANPADAAVTWLTTNGYSVGEGVPGLLRPYLSEGMHLLALKLTKGSDVGSIRPLRITYTARAPMIPIKLTAVAANNDMGVMAFVLGEARAVPRNYLALELNEARINWFNANSNYNAVVTAAADEAGGQGFVTEYSQESKAIANVVFSSVDESSWQALRSTTYTSLGVAFMSVFNRYGQWDGFWDAVRATVTLPSDLAFADLQACPNCYAERLDFSLTEFFAAVDEGVLQPMRDMQGLIDRSAQVTRLYTTLSAAEMTADPLFSFNGDLSPVSNLHTATRVIECSPAVTQFDAPWRVELPQGNVVRGVGSGQVWPAFGDQPANSRIVRVSETGAGLVVEDNGAVISQALADYNATVPVPTGMGGAVASGGMQSSSGGMRSDASGGLPATGGNGPSSGGDSSSGGKGGSGGQPGSGSAGAPDDMPEVSGSGSGCNLNGRGSPGFSALFGLAALLLVKRRRRGTLG